MKIALICYPDSSINDITSFLTPIEKLLSTTPGCCTWEFCSYLPINNQTPGYSLETTHIGLPLKGFEVIIVPGHQSDSKLVVNQEWINWLKSADLESQYFGINDGAKILSGYGFNNGNSSLEELPLNGYLTGLFCIHHFISENAAYTIANLLGLNFLWNMALSKMGTRFARFSRNSAETKIEASLFLDGTGIQNINTGIPFLDHMVSQISKHGLFDINLTAIGDLEIDPHHTMEDSAIALGEVFRLALGERKGIFRMASATVPMDESLATVTVDFSGRPYSVFQTRWKGDLIGELPVSLIEHFLESFAMAARCNLFIQVHAGNDNHHMIEAVFKALARALDQASLHDIRRAGQVPSTKDVLF